MLSFGNYIALDQNEVRHHAWITEEAIPLRNLMTLGSVDHEQVLIGYTYVLLKLCVKSQAKGCAGGGASRLTRSSSSSGVEGAPCHGGRVRRLLMVLVSTGASDVFPL